MDLSEYYGRRVLVDQPEWRRAKPAPPVEVLPTMARHGQMIRCLRCGQETACRVAALPNDEFYCPRCINLGRVATLNRFYHVPAPNQFTVTSPVLTWTGQLSPLQEEAANTVDAGMTAHRHQLLWAVTGAGKTEMMFRGIAHALARGERLAVASDRKSVV